jgi:diguanylate cyclase
VPAANPAFPFPTFRDASDAVLAYLQHEYPMGLWMVTRTVGDDWIVLRAQDRSYDVAEGDLFRWSDSFCSRMVQGHAPHIAPDSKSIPAYAQAPIGQQIPIASYIGFPLESDGELFGTLCAIDTIRKPRELIEANDIIGLLARLLSTVLEADMRAKRLSALADSLDDAAHRDALTGVLNRRGWDGLITAAEANRAEYGHVHSVVIIDLNGLKDLNDTYGHAAGDALLQRAADVLAAVTRTGEAVARIGGDEFGILLEEPDALDAASYVHRLREEFVGAGIDASVGHATSGPTVSVEQAVRDADLGMYQDKGKSAGRRAQAGGD